MTQVKKFDVITIGAGSAGLVTAIGFAAMGKTSALVEAREMGGDCTNYGCIPSKALLASAKAAHYVSNSEHFNIGKVEGFVPDFAGAMQRVRDIVEDVRSNETADVLRERGVKVYMGYARFRSPHEIDVLGHDGSVRHVLHAKNFVISTGSHSFMPPIQGIDEVGAIFNEQLFELRELPRELLVIGGGAIGCELAQAMARLGSRVTILQSQDRLLPGEEPHVSELVQQVFEKEGINVLTSVRASRAELDRGRVVLHCDEKSCGGECTVGGDLVLVSAGRRATVSGLNLEAAGIELEHENIKVNSYMQTSQPHIYACGDCIGGMLFTHVAEAEAKVVIRNIMFPVKKTPMNYDVVPWTTFIDPEVAHAGLLKSQAVEKYGEGKVRVFNFPMTKLDRAITESEARGFIELVTLKWSGRIVGATIVASRAGEMIAEVCLAMKHKIPVYKLSALIHAYPTFSIGVRKAGDMYLVETLASELRALKDKIFPSRRNDDEEIPSVNNNISCNM